MLLFQAQTPRRGVCTTHGTSVLCGHRKPTVRYTSSRQASTGDICCLSIACVNSKNFSDLALLPPTVSNPFPEEVRGYLSREAPASCTGVGLRGGHRIPLALFHSVFMEEQVAPMSPGNFHFWYQRTGPIDRRCMDYLYLCNLYRKSCHRLGPFVR